MEIVSLRDQLAEAEASKSESRQKLGATREDNHRLEEIITALEQDVDTARMWVSPWQSQHDFSSGRIVAIGLRQGQYCSTLCSEQRQTMSNQIWSMLDISDLSRDLYQMHGFACA